jgi:hypothetical protein
LATKVKGLKEKAETKKFISEEIESVLAFRSISPCDKNHNTSHQ